MNVKSILEQCGLTEQHFEFIAEAIPAGYAALRSIVDNTPMLSLFAPGSQRLGHLRNVAVQHALQLKAGTTDLFYTKDAWNAARNHMFLQLQCGQVVLTAHYCGKKGNTGVKKAIVRGELNQRNYDLFEKEKKEPDANPFTGTAYAQILHGGISDPVMAAISIPNRDQTSYILPPFILPVRTPQASKVEEVKDMIADTMKKKQKSKQDQVA